MLVLLASGLTWDDMRPNGDLIPVRRLASEGGAALLSPAVAGEPTEAAAYLTLGAGDRVAAPDREGPRIPISDVPLTMADIAAEAYPANALEGNAVRPVYVRRFAAVPPADAVGVDIGVPALRRLQEAPSTAAQLGALGDALRQAGRRVAVYGDWRAAVVGMDRRGAVYHGSVVTRLRPSRLGDAFKDADIVIGSVEPGQRPLRLLAEAALPLVRQGVDVLIVCAAPPIDPRSGRWERLGFVVAAGPGFQPHSLLTSPTTRTPGLVANVDIAPTLLHLQGLPPFSGGTGHAVVCRPSRRVPVDSVAALDRHVVATQDAALPLLVGYAALCIVALTAALLCALTAPQRTGAPPAGTVAAFVLRVTAAGPLAFLLAGRLAPDHVWQYGALVAALALLLTLAADLIAGWVEISAIGLLLLATGLAVGIDALFGAPLGAYALPSGYWTTGLRFYGVGNEYMAIAIGAALAGTAVLAPKRLVPVGVGLALILGLPWFGANAGGAFVAALAFLCAAAAVRHGRLRIVDGLLALLAAALLSLAIGLLDRFLPGSARTHVGDALAHPATLTAIATRKIARGAAVSRDPWSLAALAALAPAAALFAAPRLSVRRERALQERGGAPLGAILPVAVWAALAAALCTDSGLPATLFLLAPMALLVVHEMLNG